MAKTKEKVDLIASNDCCGGTSEYALPTDKDEIREGVQDFYAQRALNSDSCCGDDSRSNQLYDPSMVESMPEEIANFSLGCGDPITLAELQEGETVLDLGSGGGLDCFLAAREVGETGHVIGVDMTPEMLEKAGQAAEKMGFENVVFRKGYLEKLPVEDKSIDVIISNCVINLSPDKPIVFKEMFRTLKPGGRVSVSDIVTKGELPEAVQKDMAAWGACVAGALDMSVFTKGLTEAGFEDVKVTPKQADGTLLEEIPIIGVFSAAITAKKPS